jgi:hypothetical protein
MNFFANKKPEDIQVFDPDEFVEAYKWCLKKVDGTNPIDPIFPNMIFLVTEAHYEHESGKSLFTQWTDWLHQTRAAAKQFFKGDEEKVFDFWHRIMCLNNVEELGDLKKLAKYPTNHPVFGNAVCVHETAFRLAASFPLAPGDEALFFNNTEFYEAAYKLKKKAKP